MLNMLMTSEYAPAEERHRLQRMLLRVAEGDREALAELYRHTRRRCMAWRCRTLKMRTTPRT